MCDAVARRLYPTAHHPKYKKTTTKAASHAWLHLRTSGRAPLASAALHKDADDADGGYGDEKHAEQKGGVAGIAFVETPAQRRVRAAVFNSAYIPWWVAPAGYVLFAAIGVAAIPFIYPPAKWQYVLVAYAIGPLLALPNSYGAGLTDQDQCAQYAKLALFIFAAWAGTQGAGVVAGISLFCVFSLFFCSLFLFSFFVCVCVCVFEGWRPKKTPPPPKKHKKNQKAAPSAAS